ncbi:uncharacterized protein LOC117173018 isoform X1 [Belonocnema kinseyi]|uniref:uncharacterized protein LOC117173018 isoform X1 n=1 Tax=Belonocnema kinseyi TaxID=2817044 RepID=UPI00143D562A|nr:uncharacterized protein LOC117173018 isoform X1 [Belonocnema kinseyi]
MISNIKSSEACNNILEQSEHVKRVADALENRNSETRFSANVSGQKLNFFKDITNDGNLGNVNVRPHRSGHGSFTFKDSPEDLKSSQTLMLLKIHMMGVILESFGRNNGTATGKSNNQRSVTFTNKDTDLKMFPVRSISAIEQIEKKMMHKPFFDKVVHALMKIGKHVTISMTITNMLNNLLTFETGAKYSFVRRSRKKQPFNKLLFYKAICNAFGIKFGIKDFMFENLKDFLTTFKNLQQMELIDIVDPDATIALITKSVKYWLYQCMNRQEREAKNAKKAQEREKNMHLDLEQDEEDDF